MSYWVHEIHVVRPSNSKLRLSQLEKIAQSSLNIRRLKFQSQKKGKKVEITMKIVLIKPIPLQEAEEIAQKFARKIRIEWQSTMGPLERGELTVFIS